MAAQLLTVRLAATPSSSLKKGWFPSPVVEVGGAAGLATNFAIPLRDRRRASRALPVVCSVSEDGSSKTSMAEEPEVAPTRTVLGRSSFPPGFTFGTASSAYQVEGAWNVDGKGQSIWDAFTHEQSKKIADGSNGDVAINSYYDYMFDIQSLKQMGVDSYRFSISWSRILPDGTTNFVNEKGIDYYHRLIDGLIENGITPCVTLFHWDVPRHLEEKYGGFRSSQIVDDFAAFAEICFQRFGKRVKQWITVNEPWSFASMGYSLGEHAPGRCSPDLTKYFPDFLPCPVGDSTTEPYIVAHNLILAHAKVATLYKEQFQESQNGKIGITLVSMWFEPYTDSPADKDAATRLLEFMLGWFMDPLTTGDYPFSMRAIVRDRLPTFSEPEMDMIRGSYDFIGINYYSARYATSIPYQNSVPFFSILDSFSNQLTENKEGVPIGRLEGSWIYVVPKGIKELLLYIKNRYNDPEIYITENGTVDIRPDPLDPNRVSYMSQHFAQLLQAIRDGANVKGYFAWAVTDNFEWQKGYTEKFGLHFVKDRVVMAQIRHPKASAEFYERFLHS